MLAVVAERVSTGLLAPPLLTLLPLLAAAAKLCLATRLMRCTLGDDDASAFFLGWAAAFLAGMAPFPGGTVVGG